MIIGDLVGSLQDLEVGFWKVGGGCRAIGHMAAVSLKRMIGSTFDSWLTLANFLGLPDGVGRKQKL